SVDTSDPVAMGNAQRLDIVTTELQGTIMETRMQPIGNLFSRFTRVVRDLSRKLNKSVEIQVSGSEVELDNTILEALADPMTHLVRNSCDHGLELPQDRIQAGKPETGIISLTAAHESGHIHVKIEDNGRGINLDAVKKKAVEKGLKTEKEIALLKEKEIVSLILLPGFSTTQQVSDLSGRGVGMDVVNSAIERLGGSLEIDSAEGKGTSISMRLPLTLAIIPCLIVAVGNHRYAIPQVNLEELVCLYDEDVLTKMECAGNQEVYRLRDELLPMVRFEEVLKSKEPFSDTFRAVLTEKYRKKREELQQKYKKDCDDGGKIHLQDSLNFAVLHVGAIRFGLMVDRVIGTEEIVVKPMHPALNSLKCYSGATVMGDGRVAMILDVQGVVKHVGLDTISKDEIRENVTRQGASTELQSVLLFTAGKNEQFALPLPLIKHIENIRLSEFEIVGDKEYVTINGESTLIIRLDNYLKVSETTDSENMFLILPKFVRQPVGILTSSLIGTTDIELNLNTDGYMEEGLFGTSIIDEKMTLFPDIPTILKKARPEWFTRLDDKEHTRDRSRILLVENAFYYLNLLRGYLESQGYEVVTAENGEEGLEKIQGEKFDCVLSELTMPGMDGFSFLKNLRSGSNQQDVPVICLSSTDSFQERRKAEEKGFDRYEVKMDTGHLLSTVSEVVHPH
ncbi:MAG: chemotaxis protein CheW, partial [Nitrospinota bacterium]